MYPVPTEPTLPTQPTQPTQPTNESWAAVLAAYDLMVGPHWAHIPRFRHSVAALACSHEASGLSAVTSHETLIVSPYTRHPDWIEGRHVLLRPHRDGRVLIESYPNGWRAAPAESTLVAADEVLATARKVLARL